MHVLGFLEDLGRKKPEENGVVFRLGGNLVILAALGPISGPKNYEKTHVLGFFEASWARMGIIGRCAKDRKLAMLS